MVKGISAAFNRALSRHLNSVGNDLAKSLYRLSAGTRFANSYEDITDQNFITRLETQMQGINRGILNINNVQGMTNEASNALDAMLTISYQLRELVQKAQDENITDDERDSLEDEADQLLEDFQNYSANTEYNDRNLLDNTLGTLSVLIGPNPGSTFSFAIGDARATTLGKIAISSGTQGNITTAIGPSATLKINGVSITSSYTDDVSTNGSAYSALAISNSINAAKNSTGVSAEVLGTTRTLTLGAVGTYTGTIAAGEFKINGVNITGSSLDTAAELVSAINAESESTGVISAVDANGNISLTANDGRNIQVQLTNSATNNLYDFFNISQNSSFFTNYSTLSTGANTTFTGAVRIWSAKAITVEGTSASLAIGMAQGTYQLSSGTAVSLIDLSSTSDADQALKVLDTTIAQISSLRENLGGIHDRLDTSSRYLVQSYNDLDTERAALHDVDVVLETTNLVAAQLLQNSTLASLTQANVSQSTVLRLLEGLY